MNKLVIVLVVSITGLAYAQQPPAAEPAPAGEPAADRMPDPPPPPPAPDAAALRKTCADAMNADPAFAKSIVATIDKQIDERTIKAHEKAAEQIAENERHVIYAYAAMWIIAAMFVVFLWRRQQGLKKEIAQLRQELDAAAKETA